MKRLASHLSAITLLVAAAGFAAWMLSAGPMCDDLTLAVVFPDYDVAPDADLYSQPPGRPIATVADGLESFMNYCVHGYLSRLTHLLAFPSFALPQPLVDISHGLAMLLMLWSLMALASPGRWRRQPVLAAVAVALVWIVLPWENMKASSDYMFNYLWPSALNLYFLRLVTGGVAVGRRWSFALALLLSAVTGAMHEGFSIPMMSGLGMMALVSRFRLGRRRWALVIAYAVGLAWLFAFPGVYRRLAMGGSEPTRLMSGIVFVMHFLIRYPWPYIVVVGVLLMRRKAIAFCRENVIPLTAMVASFAIGLYMGDPSMPRTMWMCSLMCVLLILRMIAHFRALCADGSKARTASVAAMAVLVLFSVDLASAQRRLYRECCSVDGMYRRLPGENLFYADLSSPDTEHWWIENIATGYRHPDRWVAQGIHYAAGGASMPVAVVLPQSLEGVPLDSLPPIPGTAGLRDASFPLLYDARGYGLHQFFRVTYALHPDYAGTSVEFQPAALLRFAWRPRMKADTVVDDIILEPLKVPVTRRLIDSGVTARAESDTLRFLSLPVHRLTLRGLRPVRIDTLPMH